MPQQTHSVNSSILFACTFVLEPHGLSRSYSQNVSITANATASILLRILRTTAMVMAFWLLFLCVRPTPASPPTDNVYFILHGRSSVVLHFMCITFELNCNNLRAIWIRGEDFACGYLTAAGMYAYSSIE